MNEKIKKRMKKNTGSQHGFTLLEILVVLTIMGFLVAMVAPRLSMVGTDAVDTVCDTNQNRTVTYLATYFQKSNGSLPDGLTNLVSSDGSNSTVYAPSISDGDPDDGIKGVLSQEFGLRNNLVAHHLNAAEVAELAGLGIENVFDLNDPEDARTDAPFMNENPLADGDVVAMVGMGATGKDATDYITRGTSSTHLNQIEEDASGTEVVEYGWGEPDKLGRIVMGLGPESGLVKDGIVTNAAHCPGGLQNEDNCSYNDYIIVVPRLQASVDRLSANLFANGSKETTAIGYMDGDLVESSSGTYSVSNNTANLMKRAVKLTAQEAWEYQTQCPEGHVYPESVDHWAIDIDGNGSIGGVTAS